MSAISTVKSECSPLNLAAAEPAELVFFTTLMISAPREKVFSLWTEPSRMAQWRMPEGFTVHTCEMDMRTGGNYRLVMRSPNSIKHTLKGRFLEVSGPDRLVFTDNWEELPIDWHLINPNAKHVPAREAVNIVTFEDLAGITLLKVRTVFESVALHREMVKRDMHESWCAILKRLADRF